MSIQITVRLDDDLVRFLDRRVSEGHEKSRATAVSSALRREQRRAIAGRDALILANLRHPDELDAIVEYTSSDAAALDLE